MWVQYLQGFRKGGSCFEAGKSALDTADLLIPCTHLQSFIPAAFCGPQEVHGLENLTRFHTKSKTVCVSGINRWIKKAMDLVPWFPSSLQKWFLVQLIQGAVTAVLLGVEYLLGWQASSLPQATAPFSSLSSHASINKPTTIIPGKSVAEKSIRHSGILKLAWLHLKTRLHWSFHKLLPDC